MPSRALRAPGAYRRAPGDGHPRGPLLRCAALGPRLAGASATRCENGGERSDGPCGCLAVRLSKPLLAAPAAGRLRGGTGVEAPVHRELTRRGCPSGAAQQQSEFRGAPRNRPAAGLPLRIAKGSQTGGRLLFGDFLLARQEKVTAPPGALPGSSPPHKQAAHQRACEQRSGFDRLSPNSWGCSDFHRLNHPTPPAQSPPRATQQTIPAQSAPPPPSH